MTAKSRFARARQWWRKEVMPLLWLALLVFSIRSSLADWNDVPTGSMKPTILEGDRVFVNKLAYDLKFPFTTWHLAQWDNPRRGEVVVFYSPYDGTRLVKRVIGLPGDVVELRNNVLLLNHEPVQYEAVTETLGRELAQLDPESRAFAREQLPGRSHLIAALPQVPARRDFGPYVVPEHQFFMMGDNRDNSFDSRYYGPVERSQILGRATGVALSFDRSNYFCPRWRRFFTAF